MLDGNVKQAVLARLKRINGQVQGLQRMVEERRYCIDILHQVAAVQAALRRAAAIILKNHLETCVTDTFECEKPSDKREKIDELIRVFESMRPK